MRLFQLKLKLASRNQSKLWDMSDMEKALKDLKNNRSRDPEGLINEIFKKDVIGDDLKEPLLVMFNKLKQSQIVPKFMNIANITTVPKKGSPLLLDNERGIFWVPVLRSIFMKLIYNQKYEEIDRNMSDCQMGGRKKKGCRNNILIINGIIHDVLSSKKNDPVTLQIYDYRQMFDAICLEEALNDAFNNGIKDDNLNLIYKANREVEMSVNTSSGLTERQTIKSVVLQGDTFGSILASIQVDAICKEVESMGHGYKYKGTLPITMLAMVDDMIGVTNVGYKAKLINAAINIKTAEKRLQFGETKCKSMLVGLNTKHSNDSSLVVDKWKTEHAKENDKTNLIETYIGEVPMENTREHKYLGFILSDTGNNMKNITDKKNKSIGIIKKIFNKIQGLNLRKYFFECAIIFLNVMLRSSILYASETYYDLKETEIRALERIEENFLRQLFKTSKGCPISQLYLETGHQPARFEILRRRLLFMKSIIHEKPTSMIYKFLKLQFQNPTKGDWASSCVKALEYLEIRMSLTEIEYLSVNQFKKILEKSIKIKSFEYLIGLRGIKGSEIKYSSLKMAEYLLPNEQFSITEKRQIFAIRNRMVNIENNFRGKNIRKKCFCGNIEDMKHIYSCKIFNIKDKNIEYENIYGEDIRTIREVYQIFQKT